MARTAAAALALGVALCGASHGGRQADIADLECDATLEDYVCPTRFQEDVVVCVPPGGWHIGTCDLRFKRGGLLTSAKGRVKDPALVVVVHGRTLTINAGSELLVLAPRERPRHGSERRCTRGIVADRATVRFEGAALLRDFCIGGPGPLHEAAPMRPWTPPLAAREQGLLGGAAILAHRIDVLGDSSLDIEDTKVDRGSGGAIAAEIVEVAGSLRINRSEALLSGGAIAISGPAVATETRALRASWGLRSRAVALAFDEETCIVGTALHGLQSFDWEKSLSKGPSGSSGAPVAFALPQGRVLVARPLDEVSVLRLGAQAMEEEFRISLGDAGDILDLALDTSGGYLAVLSEAASVQARQLANHENCACSSSCLVKVYDVRSSRPKFLSSRLLGGSLAPSGRSCSRARGPCCSLSKMPAGFIVFVSLELHAYDVGTKTWVQVLDTSNETAAGSEFQDIVRTSTGMMAMSPDGQTVAVDAADGRKVKMFRVGSLTSDRAAVRRSKTEHEVGGRWRGNVYPVYQNLPLRPGNIRQFLFSPLGTYFAACIEEQDKAEHTSNVVVLPTDPRDGRLMSFHLQRHCSALAWQSRPPGSESHLLAVGAYREQDEVPEGEGALYEVLVLDVGQGIEAMAPRALQESPRNSAGLRMLGREARLAVAQASARRESGGAVFVSGGSLVLQKADFEDCFAGTAGGAIYAVATEVRLSAVRFERGIRCWIGENIAYISVPDADGSLEMTDLHFPEQTKARGDASVTVLNEGAPFTNASVEKVLLQPNGRPRLLCRKGHYLHAAQSRNPQQIVAMCSACVEGTYLVPGHHCCGPCPRGVDCSSPATSLADLRERFLPGVADEAVPNSECEVLHSQTPQCLAARRPEPARTGPLQRPGSAFRQMRSVRRRAIQLGNATDAPRVYISHKSNGIAEECRRTFCKDELRVITDVGCRDCGAYYGPGFSKQGDECVADVGAIEALPQCSVCGVHLTEAAIRVEVTANISGRVGCVATGSPWRGVLARFFSDAWQQSLAGEDRMEALESKMIWLQPLAQRGSRHIVHWTSFEGTCTVTLRDDDAPITATTAIRFRTKFNPLVWDLEDPWTFHLACLASVVFFTREVMRKSGSSGRAVLPRWRVLSLVASVAVACTTAVLGAITALHSPSEYGVGITVRCLIFLSALMYIGCRMHFRASRERDAYIEEQLVQVLALATEFQYPLALVPATVFLQLDRLEAHEELRERKCLTVLDRVAHARELFADDANLGIFFSHQWTSFAHPDPENVQFFAICEALRDLSIRQQIGLSNTYAWVDYCSVPQASLHTQRLAMNSLPMFVSVLKAFVIVAPPVRHEDTGLMCDLQSYQNRGWCRAEQLSYRIRRGNSDVFWLDAPSRIVRARGSRESAHGAWADGGMCRMPTVVQILKKQDIDWGSKAFHVFDPAAEFSCCTREHMCWDKGCDKTALVLPMLGLFAYVYVKRDDLNFKHVYNLMERDRDAVFPPYYFMDTARGRVRQELFGQLVGKLKAKLDGMVASGELEDWLQQASKTELLPPMGRVKAMVRSRPTWHNLERTAPTLVASMLSSLRSRGSQEVAGGPAPAGPPRCSVEVASFLPRHTWGGPSVNVRLGQGSHIGGRLSE